MTSVSTLLASSPDTEEGLLVSVAAGLHVPRRIVLPTSWVGHIPFASWIIAALKPRLVVELGVHTGNSFFTFAEAAVQEALPTMLYGIDTWAGDDHAGAYAQDVFADVSAIASGRFPDNVRLIRKRFDEALGDFADGSIDLLHIDGLHTYEAVRHDFETWRPKLSDRAVVLFHDVEVVKEGFGVSVFWSEMARQFPHFAFTHSNGLGVLLVGSRVPARVKIYATSDFARAGFVGLLSKLGEFLASVLVRGPDVDALPINPSLDPPRIYVGVNQGLDEGSAINARPLAGAPGALHCTIGPIAETDEVVLRIDPMNHVGIRGIHRVLLASDDSKTPIELLPADTDRRERLSIVPVKQGYLFVGTGEDSQWFPQLGPESREMLRAGATIVFEPIAAPVAALSRMLLESVETLIAPLDERFEKLKELERARALVLLETDEPTVSVLKTRLDELQERFDAVTAELADTSLNSERRIEAFNVETAAVSARFEAEAKMFEERYATQTAMLRAQFEAEAKTLRKQLAAATATFEAERAQFRAETTALKAQFEAETTMQRAQFEAQGVQFHAETKALTEHFEAATTEQRKQVEAETTALREGFERYREAAAATLASTQRLREVDRELLAQVQSEAVGQAGLLARAETRNTATDRLLDELLSLPLTQIHSDQTYIALEHTLAELTRTGSTDKVGLAMRKLFHAAELFKGRHLIAKHRLSAPKGSGLAGRVIQSDLYLEPSHGLIPLNANGTRWHCIDNDPQFGFGELCDYAGHWVELTVGIAFDEEPNGSPMIYLDRGDGMSEGGAIALPRPAPDSGIASIVFAVPTDLQNARFDPCAAPISFKLTTFRIRTISRLTAMRTMVRAMRDSGRLRHLRDTYRPQWRSLRSPNARRHLKNAFVDAYRALLKARSYAYSEWIRRFEPPLQAYPQLASNRDQWERMPLISVLMPTYETPARYLREAIESVVQQQYPNWELCIADDASKAPHVRRLLDEFANCDPRIKVVHRPINGHISAATNSALELASGEFVALLDHDDRLHPLALHYVAETILRSPSAKMIYSDEDKIDTASLRNGPYFKSNFNYELFLAQNMVSHLGCYSTELVRELGGFRLGTEGSQDWDLGLRVYERVGAANIVHIPRVLYHWREIPGSTAVSVAEKPYAQVAGRRAVEDHMAREAIEAVVLPAPGLPAWNRVKYAVPVLHPKVSIVIPTRDKVDLLRACVQSILTLTTYHNFEVVIVDNGSVEPDTAAYFASLATERIRIVRDNLPFNYSRLNNVAVKQSSGDFVCLLNNDIEVLTPDWLEEMVSIVAQPLVGIVGGRLWYPDQRLQHGGVILGIGGIASHSHRFARRGDPGYFGRAVLQQQFSAVTGACLLISRALWDRLGGLDETLAVAFNDIDLCLRAGEIGYKTVWTPFAELIHYESVSRGAEDTPEKVARFNAEQQQMRDRWGDKLMNDPFYSPNLTLAAEDFSLSWEPRLAECSNGAVGPNNRSLLPG